MKGNPLYTILVLLIGGFIWSAVLAGMFGIGFGLVGGILTVAMLVAVAQYFGAVSILPLNKMFSGLLAVVLVAFFFGATIWGVVASAGSALPSASVSDQTVLNQNQAVTSLDACAASVSDNVRGTSATLTLNGYDYANSNPLGTNVDLNGSVYAAANAAGTNQATFRSTFTDTTTGTVTTTKAGQIVTITGNSGAGYYTIPMEGVCVDGQQKSVNLKGYAVTTEANVASALFESNGNALSAGASGVDYTAAMAANEKASFQWEIKENGANSAFYLAAVGLATGANITNAYPVTTDTRFDQTGRIVQHMKDVAIQVNSTAENTETKTYTVYYLTTPVLLTEFEKFKFDFKVEASATNPSGQAGSATQNGVFGIAKDGVWERDPTTGASVFDIHDRTVNQADVGLGETEVSPNGAQTGFALVIT